MSLIIPLILIVVSGAGIFLTIRKKISFLKKLEESGFESEGAFLQLMFPEIFAYLKKIDLETYERKFYNEYEKFLRRLKIISLKIDNYANRWLEGMAEKNNSDLQQATPVVEQSSDEVENPRSNRDSLRGTAGGMESEIKKVEKVGGGDSGENLEILKKEEQRLIIEIAKNPKDSNLYKQLAEIYLEMGEKEDARESLNTALELNPEDLKIKRLLGKI